VDVVPQVLRHLHGVQLLDVIPAQVVVVVDVGVNVVAVQVPGQVDDLLQAARMVADLHRRLELFVLALAHLVQFGGQVVELVQVLILAQLVVEAVHIAVIVSDEPLLIGLAEVILLPNADPFKHLLHLLWRGGELHPFAHQVALVVLAQVGDEGGKGIILVIFIMGHIRTSLQLRLRLPLAGRLGLIFVPALLFALFQPLPDGGLAVRLLRLGAVVLPWVIRGEQIPPAGEAPPVLLQGAPAEGGGVNGGPEVVRQADGQFLLQV
ncbi:Ubiquinone/menaquinone biosynthesis C-methylase UbiE/MenG, partial [Dysosmobacter welbionis]